MKLAIFTNPERDNRELQENIADIAKSLGFEIDLNNPEIVFACGGDGTLLRAVHAYIDKLENVKFFGANFGNTGFFYDYDKTEVRKALEDLLDEKVSFSKHKLVKGELFKGNEKIEEIHSVNEIRIENNSKPILCDIFLNDCKFESYVGTGFTVCSSIGSTAYNLTLSGCAVLNDINTMQLTLVQPSNRCKCLRSSLVMGENNVIAFTLTGNNDVLLGYDFVVREHVVFDTIKISVSDKEFILVNKKEAMPQSKLNKVFD